MTTPRVKGFKARDKKIYDADNVTEAKLITSNKKGEGEIHSSKDAIEKPLSAASEKSNSTIAKLEKTPDPPKHHKENDVEDIKIL